MADKRNNNDDIENLSLDDAEVELKVENIKLEPQDVTIENLDFNVDGSGDLSSSTDNALSTGDSEKNTEPSESGKLSDNSSDVATGNSSDADASSGLNSPSSENVPANESNSENAPSEVEPSDSSDVSNNADSSEKDSGKTDGDVDNKEDKKTDSDEKKETDDKKPEQKKDDLENKNDDKKNDNKNSNDRENSPEKKDSGDKNKAPEEKKEQKNDGKKSDEKPSSASKNDKKTSSNKPGQNKNSLKDRWNNRPKNPKEFANRAKDGIKNGAKNRFNNSKTGQAVNRAKNAAMKAKQAAQKAKQATKKVKEAKKIATMVKVLLSSKIVLIVLGILIALSLLIFVVSFFISGSPLVGGEVENEENYSKYSEVDQKTIEKLKNINEEYPNGEPALAMVTAVYPYIEELHGGNVNALKANNDPDEYEDEEENTGSSQGDTSSQEITTTTEAITDNTDVEDNGNDLTEDDPYLELFRSWSFRWFKFRKLLKWTTEGEDSFTTHLRNDYFNSDKGYKAMFDGVDDKEALEDAIIKDLYNLKSDFEGYFFEVCVTSTSFESAGEVSVDEILYSPIYVDVKQAGCGGSLSECDSYYSTPITLEKYVKGVVYEELGSSDNLEQIKAQMVAAKSYAISRHLKSVITNTDGSHTIQMLWSTRDQDYCDYETGCMDVQENYGYNSPDDSLYKHYSNRGPASADKIALYDQAWEDTKDYYIIDSNNVTRGSYMNTCEKGTCMAQSELETITDRNYQDILAYFYTDYSFATIEGNHATAMVGTTSELCGEEVSGGIPDSEFKFYYQTDYPDVAFCGATDHVNSCESGSNSICSSGCGVTSYAMIISTLSDTETSFDPIAANTEAASSGGCAIGGGTNNSLFTNIANNHTGFTYENIPVSIEGAQKVIEILKNGGLVVANVQASSPFTNGGHWIVLRGIASDGSIKVADPNSQSITMSSAYDINDFINNNWLVDGDGVTHSWIGIYGPRSEEFKYAADGVATGTLGYPVEGVTGCDASDYPYYSGGGYHGGTDINSSVGAYEGMNILAADGGTVKTVKNLNYSYGSHVIIDHGNGYTTLYAHMQNGSITVSEGDLVAKGQVIGKLGSTGNSTGPHLHIELRINNSHTQTLNPCNYIGQNKSYVSQ